MIGFSMRQLVHRHGDQIDRLLRRELMNLYRPMRWIPCFMHNWLENIFKRTKKYSVIIEFADHEQSYNSGIEHVQEVTDRHVRAKLTHTYASVSCCAAKLTASAIEELLVNSPHIKKLHLDRPVHALLDTASPSIRADIANQNGLTGEGITIAVVDTGIYPHQDLINPDNRIVGFKDFINQRSEAYDDNGHGTHCAGDVAGNGYASNGLYKGPAPKAKLVGVKVLDLQGAGSLSTVMAGIQWCIDNKAAYGINVISMSLGSTATVPADNDPMVKIVESAWDHGIVICVAAGNEGPNEKTIASPGISPKVITVGAMNDNNTTVRKDDQVADFSSRGPTIDGLIKPDVLSPGVNIISLRSPRSYLDKSYKTNRVGSSYFSLSGTSMATPICAGAVALILQKYQGITPDELKQRIVTGAEDRGLPPNVQGHGYLDVEGSVNL